MKKLKKFFSGVLSTVLTIAGLLGVFFSIISLTLSTNSLSEAIAGAFLGFGFAVGNWGAMAMLHLRGSVEKINSKLIGAMLLWGIGAILLGFGGFAVFHPNNSAVLENLGFATTLCLAPGFFLSLGGVMTFLKERKRNLLALRATIQKNQDERLTRAEEYTRQIFTLLRQKNISPFLSDKTGLQNRLNDWQKHIQMLITRLSALQSNALTRQDSQDVPQRIDDLKLDLKNETDPKLRQQLKETLESLGAQQQQLTKLESLMRRIDLEVDESLATIATIYSQLQLLSSQHSVDGARADRLSLDVEEAALRLDDVLSAMDEVYQDISQS